MISHVAILCACLSDVGGIFVFEGTKTPRVLCLHILNPAARRRLDFVRHLTNADFELFRLNIAQTTSAVCAPVPPPPPLFLHSMAKLGEKEHKEGVTQEVFR